MNITDGLIQYLMLISLLTFHEFAHAWTALKCGDDTARLQGRVSLNPVVHIDPIGTVLLPLMMLLMPGVGQYLIGWAKPVPFNYHNLNKPQRDEVLIAMAGPAMNFLLAIGLIGLARVMDMVHSPDVEQLCVQAAMLSLILCFFNLIPVPPLDGSHLLRVATNMSFEAYTQFARFGFLIVIVLLQIPAVRTVLYSATLGTMLLIARIFGVS
jgi:Zn-dependent protease